MYYVLTGVAALLAGVAIGWRLAKRRRLLIPLPRRGPLPDAEYSERRGYYEQRYLASMAEYDRLVPWASGGALALSLTFLQYFTPDARSDTTWLLGYSWTVLTAALLASLFSQYTSSRIYSWRLRELDHLQRAGNETADANAQAEWKLEAARLDHTSRFWGKTTKYLNPLGGFLLVVGLALLARFAYENASSCGGQSMQTTDVVGQESPAGPNRESEQRPQPVPEKKGAEDTGEPVPSQTPPKESERR